MAIIDVLDAAGLKESAEKGKAITDKIQSEFHPSDDGFGKEIQKLSNEEFEAFVIYKAHIVLDSCNLPDEKVAEQLPRAIQNAKIQYMKKYDRAN